MKTFAAKSCFALLLLTFSISAQGQLSISFTGTPYCNDTSYGSVCAVVSGGTPPYSYDWSNGVSGLPCISFSPAWGNWAYSITVSDGMGITASAAVNPLAFAGMVVNVKLHTLPEDCDNNNGMAWVEITSGLQPYDVWFGPLTGLGNPFNDTIYNVPAGDYYFNVTDANGCIGIDTALLNIDTTGSYNWFTIQKNLPYSYTITKTNHDCPVLGTAAVHVTGGLPPITYEWSTVPPEYTDSVGGLFGGYYTVTIADATVGCSVEVQVYIYDLNPLNAATTSTQEVCDYNNGTATIIPQNGTPPYTYIWNTVPIQTTSTATNLSQGAYYGTVYDANQCSAQEQVYVAYTSPVQPNPVVVNEVCGDASGTITLTPLLGTPPYVYQWSSGGSANVISNLRDGIYSFTVNDAEGCSVVGSASLQDVPPFNITMNYTSATCLAPGTSTANVSGGTGPFTYNWNTTPAQTTATATGLAAGYYVCTITDANGCPAIRNVYVQYDPLVHGSLSSSAALCQSATGSVTCFVNGGQAPYTYSWSNGANTQNISGVTPGGYNVTITDANNCSVVKGKVVETYSNLGLTIATVNATCIFTTDGQATAQVSNATPPITYRWGNGQTSQTATGLHAQWSYGVLVTDANGCTITRCAYIGYNNLSCAVQVSGKVVKDLDTDCSFTPGDEGVLGIPVNAVPGYYDRTDNNGDYGFIIPPGNYAVNHTPPYHMFQLCPEGSVELFGMIAGDDTIVDFFDTVRTALDLSIGFCHLTDPRPGFNHLVSFSYANNGNLTANAVVEYEYDADVQFVSAVSGGYVHDVANRKVTFTFNNLAPGFFNTERLTFQTSAATTLGTQVKDCISIFPVLNDVNFVNNAQCDSVVVLGSYDPNDKAVSPEGVKVFGSPGTGYITRDDSVLYYKIRFQNTGTYYAENVAILDTLDEDLDPSTIERISSSHYVRTDFFMNKYLAFYFDNIYLPDSFNREDESHGYVSFYIKMKPMLPHGTEIKNRGAIYFDYNEPVITNTVTLIVSAPTGAPEISPGAEGIIAYPNPAEDEIFFALKNPAGKIVKAELLDLSGKQCAQSATRSISVASLPVGMYFFRIFTDDGKVFAGKVMKQ